MSQDLGTIEYTVDAKTKGLIDASKKAERALDGMNGEMVKSGKSSKKLDVAMTKVASGVKKAIAPVVKISSALVAAGTAFAYMANSASTVGKEIKNMARLSNVSVERFQELAFGAKSAGVSAEKLGDIFKDVQDKVGDFLATGGGELADYFENIAPLVGQTAEEFRGLSGPDALIKFKQGLDAVNLSAGEQIFYLESLASDAALLSPLLADNAKGFKDAANEARDLNLVLSDAEVDELVEVNREFNKLLGTIAKVSQKIVAENGPEIRQAIQAIVDIVINGSNAIRDFFVQLGGGSDLAKAQSKLRSVEERLAALRGLGKNQFLPDFKSKSLDDLNDAVERKERASREYDRIESDKRLNVDIKADRLDELRNRIQLLNGEIGTLHFAVKDEHELYVSAQTVAATEEINKLEAEIDRLNGKPLLAIEVQEGQKELKPNYDQSSNEFMGPGIDRANYNVQLRETLGITQELANEIESLDQKFQNVGETIKGSLYQATMQWSDAAGQTMAQNIADSESLDQGLRDVARTIATQLLGSLISLGIQYGINSAIAMATGTAVATASAAEASALSTAWAPAAAGASIATAGGAAVAGGSALAATYGTAQGLAVAGGRLNGGPVSAGSLYNVNENGRPEMLTVGNKQMLMMGNQSGSVTSNKDMMMGAGGSNVVVNINNSASGSEASATSRQQDGKTIIDVVVADINSRGKVFKSITNNTTANNRL